MANSTEGLVNWWMPIYTLYEVFLHTISFHSPHEKTFGVTSPATIRSSMEKSVARSPNSRYKQCYAQPVPRYSGIPWDHGMESHFNFGKRFGFTILFLNVLKVFGILENLGLLDDCRVRYGVVHQFQVRPSKVSWLWWHLGSFWSKEKHFWVRWHTPSHNNVMAGEPEQKWTCIWPMMAVSRLECATCKALPVKSWRAVFPWIPFCQSNLGTWSAHASATCSKFSETKSEIWALVDALHVCSLRCLAKEKPKGEMCSLHMAWHSLSHVVIHDPLSGGKA